MTRSYAVVILSYHSLLPSLMLNFRKHSSHCGLPLQMLGLISCSKSSKGSLSTFRLEEGVVDEDLYKGKVIMTRVFKRKLDGIEGSSIVVMLVVILSWLLHLLLQTRTITTFWCQCHCQGWFCTDIQEILAVHKVELLGLYENLTVPIQLERFAKRQQVIR